MAKKKFVALVSAGAVILIALIVALVLLLTGGLSGIGSKTFADGTTINGIDVSGLDAEGAAAALADSAKEYSFTLKLGDTDYTATAEELQLSYNQGIDLQALLDEQKADKTKTDFSADDLFTSDPTEFLTRVEQEYESAQTETTALAAETTADAQPETEGTDAEPTASEDESPVDPAAPQNAYLSYDEAASSFIIVPEKDGTRLDWDSIAEQVRPAVRELQAELALKLEDLTEKAEITSTDETLQTALANANSYLDLQLTYTFTPDGGTTASETLDRATLGKLYYLDEDDMSIQVDEEVLGSLVNTLAEQHAGSGSSTGKFTTHSGSTINISVAREGQSVDTTALYNDMLECLRNKTGGTRAAAYNAVSDSSDTYWGGNYVEIDQTSQHLWLYKNGSCILDCSVVSGNVANNTRTPNGCFTIFAKNKDRYLQGTNVNGTRYKSWVNYFMPFSGGCGIHDATWRSSFGGDIYLYSGSHGCVGVSLSNAKTIYNNVEVGTHVIVYGGASPDNIPARSQTVTASIGASELTVGSQTTVSVSSKTTPQFSSSNSAVATVDASGNVTAVGAGTATITVTCPASGSYAEGTASVTITVNAPAHVHSWSDITEVRHHDAETHNETTTVTVYQCSGCGAEFESKTDCEQHIASARETEAAGSSSSGTHASAEVTENSKSVTTTVVDKQAWDETVVTGRKCSGCGAVETY